MPEHILYLLIGGFGGFAVGGVLLALARAADRRNYIIQRATPMPLALVNERDDVWLRGEAECDSPLTPPHFDIECLYYDYKLEERVQRTRETKHGTETYYTWEPRQSSSEAAAFRLREGEQSIDVDGAGAEFKDLEFEIEEFGDWRHSLRYTPYPATLSAVGSVSEKRKRLEKHANIPLLVTPKGRDEYIRDAERGEKYLRFFGFLLVWVGAGAGLYGVFDHLSWPAQTAGAFAWATLLVAAGAGTAVFVPVWTLYIYNTFVTYNVRVENSWRQIDVDLKMRYDLVPNLVAAAKRYLKHEKELLERLTAVRAEATSGGRADKIAAEPRAVRAIADVAAVVEKYPKLKSRRAVKKLMRELTAIEEKIGHGRKTYNNAVEEYNTNVLSFPRMLLARACGFGTKRFFEAVGEEREAAKV